MSSAPLRGLTLFASFSAAVFVAVYLLPASLWPALGLCALMAAGLFLWRRWERGTLLCLGIAAGLLWCAAFSAVFFAPAQALDGRRTELTLCLSQRPTVTPHGAYAEGWVIQDGQVPVRAMLYGGQELVGLNAGDRVSALCDCDQTALSGNERLNIQSSYGVFLTLAAQGVCHIQPTQATPWWCVPQVWGEKLSDSIRAYLPGDVSGILAALAAGDRSGIDPAVETDLERAGLSHLVALSGMHISFLMGLLTRLTGYDPKRRAIFCAPVLIFFTLAVGAAASVVRACFLHLVILLGDLLGREAHRWTSLFAALAFLLLLDPFCVANAGLQLSFAAVAGIGVVTPRVVAALNRFRVPAENRLAQWLHWRVRRLFNLLAVTLGALLFTVPLSAFYFGAVPLAAPLSNLLVLPVASVLFAGTLILGLLGMVWPGAAVWLGQILALPARYVLWVAKTVSALPHSSVPADSFYYALALAGGYALVLLALLWRGQRRRVWLFLLCAAVLASGGILLSRQSTSLTVTVLDVGQGQSVVLSAGEEIAVIDCGGDSAEDPGDLCADCLCARGEDTVDKLILTHYHTDHACGVDALFRRLEIREVICPRMEPDQQTQLHILELAQAEGAAVTWLERDQTVALGDATLRLFAPLGDGGANEEGLSALVTAGGFSMLVTGDMNTVVEEALVAHADLPRCQVLLAGHHGSAAASGDALLDAVEPQAAVISVGADNPYGHPSSETLSRLESRGVRIYRTDQLGHVTIRAR